MQFPYCWGGVETVDHFYLTQLLCLFACFVLFEGLTGLVSC